MKKYWQPMIAFALVLSAAISVQAADIPPLTVEAARTLPTSQLARELLGERLASRVIEARRYEYDASTPSVPEYVEFYTQPQLSMPVLNGICSIDVITIEYDWYKHDAVTATTPLEIARVVASSRYKAFTRPAGEPGSSKYGREQAAACAAMSVASDGFRAPDAGDAQWLAAISAEYSSAANRFTFSCSDFADHSCAAARSELPRLTLASAVDVREVACPNQKTGDQLDLCFRLAFPYAGTPHHADFNSDDENIEVEWVLTVFAGIRDGLAPVRIRSLHLEHIEKPRVIY